MAEEMCDRNPLCRLPQNKTMKEYLKGCSDVDSCKLMMIELFFTIKERFKISLNISSLMPHKDYIFNFTFPQTYMLGKYVCYQMLITETINKDTSFRWTGDLSVQDKEQMLGYHPFNLDRDAAFQYITDFRLAITPTGVLPHFEFFTNERIEWKENGYVSVTISSYYYRFVKLEPPYVDGCVDYTALGFMNRLDAVNSCLNEKCIKVENRTARTKIFPYDSLKSGDDYPMSWLHDKEGSKECNKRYPNDDCDNELTYTDHDKIIKGGNYKEKISYKRIEVSQILSTKPSYEVTNHAQIDPVDFVTYIFGAAGTWFGFSFMTFQPVSLIEWIIAQINRKTKIHDCANAQGVSENKNYNQESILNMFQCVDEKIEILHNRIKITNASVRRMNKRMKSKDIKMKTKLKEMCKRMNDI